MISKKSTRSLKVKRWFRSLNSPERVLYKLLGGPGLIRRLTSYRRSLPVFLVIGAMRSGTTSLYQALTSHPGVQAALVKEVHFFDFNYGRGLGWYRAHFPLRPARSQGAAPDPIPKVTGEATPLYLYDPCVPARVREDLPNIRLIAILRNPVDRTYSNYWQQVRRGHEKLNFRKAIEQEPARLQIEETRLHDDPNAYRFNRHHYSYIGRSLYAQQVTRWLAEFPKDRLMAVSTEQFRAGPKETLNRLVAFLGLEPIGWSYLTDKKFNRSRYPPMDAGLREALVQFFRPYNQQLFDILGESFDWDR